jgi:hypothetical protein
VRDRVSVRSAVSLGVLVLAAVASLATSAPRSVRRYPTWRVERQEHVVDGAVLQVWVSRSGREGLGVSVEIDARDTGMSFEVDGAATVLRVDGGEEVRPTRVERAPSPPDRVRRYLAFRFDGLAAWNEGHRHATLALALRTPAATRTILLSFTHSLESPHTTLARP